jgi:Tol biopolymer transport system component
VKTFLTGIAGIALAATIVGAAGGAAQDAERQLKAAMNTELVDGNLKAAIEQYKKVAESGNRALAAQALLHMADCYQKLGDREAQRLYERVARDYGDQKEAATLARVRLGGGASAPIAKGDRAVWTGGDVDLFGTVSPDGRFLTYTDWSRTNNIMLRDLAAGTSRPLTNNTTFGQFGSSGWSAISRNGDQFAFEWAPRQNPDELRIANLAGSGVPSSRRLRQFEQGESVRPFDWSPDGKWIAVLVERVDKSSLIGLVSVADGTLRPLKSIDWRAVNKMVFSPDGGFIAYDLSVTEPRPQTHVFVMAIDGSRERAVIDDPSENNVMAWAPDGRLVFASNRSGSLSLWVVRVEDGRAVGTPRLVKENIGSSWSLGMSQSGTLYTWKQASAPFVKVVPFDLKSGELAGKDADEFQRFIESRGRPSWSADGKHFLYISCGTAGGGTCKLFVRSADTGTVRQVPHPLRYLVFPRLAPDGHAIVTNGRDAKGRDGIYLIDATTGATSLITFFDTTTRPRDPDWSPDGHTIRYQEIRGRDVVIVERETQSEKTREIFRAPLDGANTRRISPDGRLVGYIRDDAGGRASTFMVMPMAGGNPTPVLSGGKLGFYWQWLPDSQGVLVTKFTTPDGDDTELWTVPLNGTPRRVPLDMRQSHQGGLAQIDPEGRHLAYVATAGEPGAAIWALENFLPAPTAAKQSAKK